MMRNRTIVRTNRVALGMILAAGIALAGTALAQARVEEKGNIAVTGDILALDPQARSITLKSTNDDGLVYVVDDAATIMKGGRDIGIEELKTGWNVAASGHDDGTVRRLTLIKVVKAP